MKNKEGQDSPVPTAWGPTGQHDKQDEIVGARFASLLRKKISRVFVPSEGEINFAKQFAKRAQKNLSCLSCRPVGLPRSGDRAILLILSFFNYKIFCQEKDVCKGMLAALR